MIATLEFDANTESKALARALKSTEAYIVLYAVWDRLRDEKCPGITIDEFNDLCEKYGIDIFNELD